MRMDFGGLPTACGPHQHDSQRNRCKLTPETPRSRECSRRLGLPPDAATVIVTIGRLAVQKGHRYLLEACAILLRDVPPLQVVVAGEGGFRDELAAYSRGLCMEHSVHFVGHRTTSTDSGCSRCFRSIFTMGGHAVCGLLEAMASGVPVVATNVAGAAELVETDVTGVLVPPRDARTLADGMHRLMLLPDRGRRMAETGRARIDTEFGISLMLTRTIDLYRHLLI